MPCCLSPTKCSNFWLIKIRLEYREKERLSWLMLIHEPVWMPFLRSTPTYRDMKVIDLSCESHQPSLSQRQRCLDGWLHNFACDAGRLIKSSVPAIRQERIDSLPCAHEASRNALARHCEAFDAAAHQKMITSVVLHPATQICVKIFEKSVRESLPFKMHRGTIASVARHHSRHHSLAVGMGPLWPAPFTV